jgi:hypothetical protein
MDDNGDDDDDDDVCRSSWNYLQHKSITRSVTISTTNPT